MVEPVYSARFGAQFIIESKWSIANPLLVQFDPQYREQIKFRYATMFGDQLWIMPQHSDTPGFASIVTTGDSMDACFDQAQKIASTLNGIGIDCKIGALGGLKENLKKFAELGVKFD